MINVHEEEEDEGGIDIEGTLLPRARQRPPPREEGARRLPGRGGNDRRRYSTSIGCGGRVNDCAPNTLPARQTRKRPVDDARRPNASRSNWTGRTDGCG